ncbi:hypothetical protein [Natronoflexus pectinivorans]|uniref:Uncharacterized protein n=1 Tax=Natronoflexus pectinivorans TaxID=682526 RepID=A0A4R2GMC5_9BACT|nr:hypothetical protein [Natronoflexus pectinivorans]TCO10434.1 hypothetical protein EV194_10164 [Natronoflexus pectinivorans]
MKKFLPLFTVIVFLLGCQKQDKEVSIRPVLREKFHGKYEIVSCVSNIPVDLNNDGVESCNLFEENSLIPFAAKIEIMIPFQNDTYFKYNEFTYRDWWPTENERRLSATEIVPTHTTYTTVSFFYDYRPSDLRGVFADDLKSATFTIIGVEDTLLDIKLDILFDDHIKVTSTRKLYTRTGWVTVEIESVYRRYYKGL